MKALQQVHERVRAAVRESVETAQPFTLDLDADSPVTAQRGPLNDDFALELVAALHPLLQTLVLGVADIYQQRLRVLTRLAQAEAQEMLSVTQQMLRSAQDAQRYAQACARSVLGRLRADIDERFVRDHARALMQALQGPPHLSLEARLEHSAQQACQASVASMCAPPTLALPALPEPLPWKQLEARVRQWREQASKTREVMQASQSGAIDGLQLSHTLRAIGSDAAECEPPDPLPSWDAALVQAEQREAARDTLGTSRAVVLLARLRCEYDSARRTAERIDTLVKRTVRAHLLRHFAALERWELHYVDQLKQKKQTALSASTLGEEALKRELEAATAQNSYAWRAVQRAVQSIRDHFHAGLRFSTEATAAAALSALETALAAKHDLDGGPHGLVETRDLDLRQVS